MFTELVCQLEGFAVAVAVMVIWGILGFVIEWYWNMAIGAMHAGVVYRPAVFHLYLYCRKEMPCTFPSWLSLFLLTLVEVQVKFKSGCFNFECKLYRPV